MTSRDATLLHDATIRGAMFHHGAMIRIRCDAIRDVTIRVTIRGVRSRAMARDGRCRGATSHGAIRASLIQGALSRGATFHDAMILLDAPAHDATIRGAMSLNALFHDATSQQDAPPVRDAPIFRGATNRDATFRDAEIHGAMSHDATSHYDAIRYDAIHWTNGATSCDPPCPNAPCWWIDDGATKSAANATRNPPCLRAR